VVDETVKADKAGERRPDRAPMPGTREREDSSCEWENVFGGQAVIEGVMMRGRHSWGLAVRRPSGGIARVAYPLTSLGDRHRWLRLPVVRGVIALFESMSLGVKALGVAANISLEEAGTDAAAGRTEAVAPRSRREPEPSEARASGEPGEAAFGWKALAGTVVVAVAFAIGLFIVIPLVVVKAFEETFSNPFVFNLVEGVIRIALFLLYILGISLIPDLRRVFQYHGAEHKVIHAYEAYGRPDAERAVGYPPMHPRCGSGFVLVVMVIAILVFAVVGKPDLLWLVISRIVGIPIIIGISYEVGIKWLGKHPKSLPARVLLWPGLQLQRLTTRQPSSDQLEVAAAALDEVMKRDEARLAELKEAAAQA
jgi:uncharacterized protein YqhQ